MRLQTPSIGVLCATLLFALATPGYAKPSPDTVVATGGSLIRPVKLEHRFFFRFRPELVIGGDLGTGASGVPTAIPSPTATGDETSTLAWASLKFRYGLRLHLGQRFAISFEADAFDNVVMGANPVNGGAGFFNGLFWQGQASPTTFVNSWRDAIRVRQAYGTWRFFDAVTIDFGRMADSFGLGIVRNAGSCADCDFGTILDGVRFGLQFGSIRFNALIAFTDIGALTARPGWEGQDRDLGGQDDTITWSLRLTSAPRTAEERAKRRVLLNERRRVAIDWGIFASFTEQVLTARNQPAANLSGSCTPYAQTANGTLSLPWNCWQLTPRDLFIARPSVWTRFEWRPDFRSTLKLELEFSAFIGDATTLQGDPDLGDTSKDFLGFAGALEFSFSRNRWRVGLDAGFATGDDGRYLGYLDGQNIVDPDDANYLANDNVRLNSQVTSFWFHRDYRLDLILFRQVLGGVTNAIYVKPYASFHLLKNSNIALSARLDILYAAAARPSGTPGKGHHYGVEFDASLRLELAKGLGIDLTAGVLVPMDALRDPDTLATPNPAYAIRGLFTWRY